MLSPNAYQHWPNVCTLLALMALAATSCQQQGDQWPVVPTTPSTVASFFSATDCSAVKIAPGCDARVFLKPMTTKTLRSCAKDKDLDCPQGLKAFTDIETVAPKTGECVHGAKEAYRVLCAELECRHCDPCGYGSTWVVAADGEGSCLPEPHKQGNDTDCPIFCP
jgi:hypothetical protein